MKLSDLGGHKLVYRKNTARGYKILFVVSLSACERGLCSCMNTGFCHIRFHLWCNSVSDSINHIIQSYHCCNQMLFISAIIKIWLNLSVTIYHRQCTKFHTDRRSSNSEMLFARQLYWWSKYMQIMYLSKIIARLQVRQHWKVTGPTGILPDSGQGTGQQFRMLLNTPLNYS